jgi:hypothetical protein
MRSNREKKKPKQDKNTKTAEMPSFAGVHSQVRPGTSYKSHYGKKR